MMPKVLVLIATLIAIVVGVTLLEPVLTGTSEVEEPSASDTFTAANDNVTAETFTLSNNPCIEATVAVTVNGAPVTPTDIDCGVTDPAVSTFTLAAADSTTGDTVVANYNWTRSTPAGTGALVDLIPIIAVVALILGVLGAVRRS